MAVKTGIPAFMSEREAAARIGVSRVTLLRARRTGKVAFVQLGTRAVYTMQQIKEFAGRRRRGAACLAV
jgi:predicted site-specific integrase-resolvase